MSIVSANPVSSLAPHRRYVTVAIILHGEPLQIRRVIEAVGAEETATTKITVLCLDDGTSPHARHYLDSIGAWVVDIKRGASIAEAKNEALRLSPHELILFLDDHICLASGGIAAAAEMLESNARLAGVCGFYHVREDSDWNVLRDIKRQAVYGKSDSLRTITIENFTTFSTGIALVRRTVFSEHGFVEKEFPPDFGGEDVPTVLSLLNRGWHLAYLPALRGVHEHNLSMGDFVRKIEVEVRGRYSVFVWAARNPGVTVPYLHGFFNVPIGLGFSTLVAGILAGMVSKWFLAVPVALLCNEVRLSSRCLHPALPYRVGTKLLAVAYILGSDLLTVGCGMQYLISSYKRPFPLDRVGLIRMIQMMLKWELSKLGMGRIAGENVLVVSMTRQGPVSSHPRS